MGNSIHTSVDVRIPEAWNKPDAGNGDVSARLPDFLAAMFDEFYDFPYCDRCETSWTFSGSVSGGVGDNLMRHLELLEQHHIPYRAYDEPYEGGAASLRVHLAHLGTFTAACIDGEPILFENQWRSITEGVDKQWGDVETFYRVLGTSLDDVSIAHLDRQRPPRPAGDTDVVEARQIIGVLASIGITDVEVEHTGGGCASVVIGCDDEGVSDIMIGPGSYDWKNPDMSEFWLEELSVGTERYDDIHIPAVAGTLDSMAIIVFWLREQIRTRQQAPTE